MTKEESFFVCVLIIDIFLMIWRCINCLIEHLYWNLGIDSAIIILCILFIRSINHQVEERCNKFNRL